MPISRKHIFLPNDPILVDELLGELDQVYSFLNGTIADRIILQQETANTNLLIHNLGGPSIEFKKGNVARARILANQQFESLIPLAENIPPIDVVSTTKVTDLNADFLDDKSIEDFVLVNVKHVENFINFYFDIPAGGPIATTNRTNDFIVPAGTTMVLQQITFRCGRIVDDSSVTLSLRKNGVSIASATLSFDVANEPNATVVLATSVAENDIISLVVDVVVNDPAGVFFVSGRLKFKQELSA